LIGLFRQAGGPGKRVARASPGAGFTLVEALLVISLISIVGSAVLSLFIANARFYAWSRDVIIARQNVRGTIEMVATEIRQVAAGDFIAAEPDSLALRFDVSRAVVCDSISFDQIALVVFDSVRAPNVPSGFRGTAISEPYDSAFTWLDGWTATLTAKGAGPESICQGRGVALKVSANRYRELRGWGLRYGRLPERGAIVRTYGRLSYRLSPSTFDPGLAVRRNGQEVAAPFDSASGFSYVMANGGELSSVSPSEMSEIAAVRIRLIAGAGTDPNRVLNVPPASADHLVFLRN
jgi:type II secretory pathway pseudopilin PulG